MAARALLLACRDIASSSTTISQQLLLSYTEQDVHFRDSYCIPQEGNRQTKSSKRYFGNAVEGYTREGGGDSELHCNISGSNVLSNLVILSLTASLFRHPVQDNGAGLLADLARGT